MVAFKIGHYLKFVTYSTHSNDLDITPYDTCTVNSKLGVGVQIPQFYVM
jgi:hypothetical protein